MKEINKNNLIIGTALFVIVIGACLTYYYTRQKDNYWAIGVFFLDLIMVIVGAVIAFILSFFKSTKPISQGLLIGVGIVSLIGLSVCSFA